MIRLFLILIVLSCFACNTGPDKAFDGNADSASFAGKPVFTMVPAAEIPQGITVKGDVEEAWNWKDAQGEHLLILSRVLPYDETGGSEEEDAGQTSEIYAAAYLLGNGEPQRLWLVSEKEENCPLDLTCNFLPGSTTITDLDSNGVAEIKVQYEKTCRGDVSPSNMKLIMYEGKSLFVLEGVRWVFTEPGDVFNVTGENVNLEKLPRKKDDIDQMIQAFGRYETEKAFTSAPPAFLEFARGEWLRYAKENIGGN